MILLNNVVEVFDLADLDIRIMLLVIAFDRRGVGAALVDRDLLGLAMTADRLAQKAQRRPAVAFGRQQKVNRVAGLVDGSVQVFPLALDPHICFVQPPADAHGTLATMKGLLQQRDILQHPAIDRGMVDLDAPFFHHLLELPVADRICDVPAYAPEDDVPLKMAAFKIDHRGLSPSEAPAIRTRDRVGQNLATEPALAPTT